MSNLRLVGWLVGCNTILHSYGDFNITGEGQQNYTFARRLWPLRMEGSWSCHTCCDTGLGFLVSSEGPPHMTSQGYWWPTPTQVPTGPYSSVMFVYNYNKIEKFSVGIEKKLFEKGKYWMFMVLILIEHKRI